MQMSLWQRWRTYWHLFIVGVRRRMVLGTRVAALDGDKVLLVRHTYIPGWHFPGGGVEPGEAAHQSAERELLEETGLRPRGALRLLGLYHNVHEATNRDHLAFFVCREFDAPKAFRPNAEIAEIGWFARGALPDDIEPGVARRVAEIFDGAPIAPRW